MKRLQARQPPTPRAKPATGTYYAAIWRWHFYAGLFVLPFILILSVTGSIYLFKPQLDRWEQSAYRNLGTEGGVSADHQLEAAMKAFPGARFNHYRLPERPEDAAMIQFGLSDGSLRDVFVSPQGKVLGSRVSYSGLSDQIARFHGSLMLGKWGDWLVELAASWTIVMILTGLYLWWPRPLRLAGTLWPRMSLRGRPFLKDIHRVTGFWIAGLALVTLVSGLPWAGAWGSAFKWARTELGLIEGPQEWKIGTGNDRDAHGHGTIMTMPEPSTPTAGSLPLSTFVAKAQTERMAFPVLVLPPHAPQRFGPPTGNEWTAKSEAQNRQLNRQVTYDPIKSAETGRSDFADKHVIDRIVNTGIAWHEGQLFGLANQLIGVAMALGLIATSVVGLLMWLKRRPVGQLGAPPAMAGMRLRWAIAGLFALGVLLPLFGASVVLLALVDRIGSAVRRKPA